MSDRFRHACKFPRQLAFAACGSACLCTHARPNSRHGQRDCFQSCRAGGRASSRSSRPGCGAWWRRMPGRSPSPAPAAISSAMAASRSSIPARTMTAMSRASLRPSPARASRRSSSRHTHMDHSPAAAALAAATGAPTYGAGPHRSARPLRLGEINLLDASADHRFHPAIRLGRRRHRRPARPGRCRPSRRPAIAPTISPSLSPRSTSCSPAIMSWPGRPRSWRRPDGAMGDYMASLQKLLGRRRRPCISRAMAGR